MLDFFAEFFSNINYNRRVGSFYDEMWEEIISEEKDNNQNKDNK